MILTIYRTEWLILFWRAVKKTTQSLNQLSLTWGGSWAKEQNDERAQNVKRLNKQRLREHEEKSWR